MTEAIQYFQQLLHTAFFNYFHQVENGELRMENEKSLLS